MPDLRTSDVEETSTLHAALALPILIDIDGAVAAFEAGLAGDDAPSDEAA